MSDTKTEAQRRKERPIARGLLGYFPRACAYVAHVSFVGNEQHNKGEPMHWALGKSTDHLDCQLRHMADHLSGAPLDSDGLYHLGKNGWRAMAALETFLWAVDLGMPNPERVTSADIEAELKRRALPQDPVPARAPFKKPGGAACTVCDGEGWVWHSTGAAECVCVRGVPGPGARRSSP